MHRPWWRRLSLASSGSKHHLTVAVSLLTVLPLLCLLFIFWSRMYAPDACPAWLEAFAGAAALAFGAAGYALLRRYPRNIVHLRRYLQEMAEGHLPDTVTLEDPEDDIEAVQRYMNTVVAQMRERVVELQEQLNLSERMQGTIRLQAEELMAAERQRVMIESLAAACHHIGQPATVLRVQLELMRQATSDRPDAKDVFTRCERAVDELAEVLEKLRRVSEYRTVPYLTYGAQSPDTSPSIVDIRADASQFDPSV